MPINFNTLVASEQELKKMFGNFYKHILTTYEMLQEKLNSKEGIKPSVFNTFEKREDKANQFEANLLNETNWIISKDIPRAAHLRYLVAIIRSIKDLERMGDFAFSIARYFAKHRDVYPEIKKILMQALEDSIHTTKVFYRAVMSKTKIEKEYIIRSASPLMDEYKHKYSRRFKDLGEIIFSKKKNVKGRVGAFKTLDYLGRNAEHAYNIVKCFIYINQPDFYFKRKRNYK